MSNFPHSPGDPSRENAVNEANAWVAQFAPLVMNDEALTESEVRQRLETIKKLKWEASLVQSRLSTASHPDDHGLVTTLVQAASQLESVEDDLRVRLGKLAPGVPRGW